MKQSLVLGLMLAVGYGGDQTVRRVSTMPVLPDPVPTMPVPAGTTVGPSGRATLCGKS